MSDSANPPTRKRKNHPRYDYRARSHANAHANGIDEPHVLPEHPLIPRGLAALVDTDQALSELIVHLRAAGRFAYDSEFIGELSFHPKLCLIQVATSQRIALIDALAAIDLTEFWRLLADPSVEKIVHAGQQDLEPVLRHLEQSPANIIDTQIAAGFVGLAYPAGLSKLVRELVGVQLGKGFTFTHWDQRPLSGVQLRYAADDVRFLPAIRAEIGRRLEAQGMSAWAAEESEALTDPNLYRFDPATALSRMRGAGSLAPRNAAVLRELADWRQDAARRYDMPPRSYVKDEVVVEMARLMPQSAERLAKVRGLPRPVEEAETQNIIAAVVRGLAVPEADCPVSPQAEENPSERFAGDAIWAAAQAWCHGHGIDPNLVASRSELIRFARELRNGNSPANSRLSRGWRKQFLAEFLGRFLAARSSVVLRWQDDRLQADENAAG